MMKRRTALSLIGGALAYPLLSWLEAAPAVAQASKDDDNPIKRLLMGPMNMTIADPKTGPQRLTMSLIILGLEKDVKRIQQNNQKITDRFLKQMETMRSPDLEGAAGILRVKELMTVSVLDAMGFDYIDVYVTQFFVSRR